MTHTELETLAVRLRQLMDEWGPEATRAAFVTQTATLEPQAREWLEARVFGGAGDSITGDKVSGDKVGGDKVVEPQGTVTVDGTLRCAVVGVNQGTVHLFFGTQPPADGKELLDSYLEWLVAEHGRLRLGKLLGKAQSGREQETMPALSLRAVYTSLATSAWIAGESFTLPPDVVLNTLATGNPSRVLPDKVHMAIVRPTERHGRNLLSTVWHDPRGGESLSERWQAACREVSAAPDGQPLQGRWYRPETPLTAMVAYRRLVLLGSPGSGKSTVLRYLTTMLAEALLAGRGRDTERPRLVPLFCQLGRVAQDFGDNPAHDLEILVNALLRPVFGPGGLRTALRTSIFQAWRRGTALLCLDGLDEVTGMAEPAHAGQRSRRERMAIAIRQLARQAGHTRIIVTCRTKPYEQDAAWQLREDWTVCTLRPFSFGQVRHFVTAWYTQTCATPQPKYTLADAQTRATRLITTLEHRATLQELTTSPLLLTMLALLDYNHKELPEKRVDVYEELVKLLLDRWEGIRSSDQDQRQQSIGERLGLPHLTTDDLRPVIHELAFTAHQQAVDGRGVLAGEVMRRTFDVFFARKLNPVNPRAVLRSVAAQVSETFEQVLRAESGLIQEEADEVYVLPHLTFEEYLGACYLAGREDIKLAYDQWQIQGDRWREVLLLLMGRLLRQEKIGMAFAWLQLLVAERCGTDLKTQVQRQRDALFAAACYAELGRRAYLASGPHDVIDFEVKLQTALVNLLEYPDSLLVRPQRIEAGDALAAIGDSRMPVTIEEWRKELSQRTEQFGASTSYFCYIRPGTYRIGWWKQDNSAHDITLPTFWIARFPITVAQYAPFVDVGYGPNAWYWWPPNGWIWKKNRAQPWGWNESPYDGRNQPVIGMTWYEAAAFCAWLTEQVQDLLPDGYIIRLPTEAEWEAAASYDSQMQRHPYPWGKAEPTPERAIYTDDEGNRLGRPAPVGCCPAGAAACGAQDMVGNVWELTTSGAKWYPAQSGVVEEDFIASEGNVPWRGGSWWVDSRDIHCGSRVGDLPVGDFSPDGIGFRVVAAPAYPILDTK